VEFKDIATFILDYLMCPHDDVSTYLEDVMTLRLVSKGLKNIVDNYEPLWHCFDKEQPLLLPTLFGNANNIELLLAMGADINKHGSSRWNFLDCWGLSVGPNPLQLAARFGALSGAEILIENGADLTPGEKYLSNGDWKQRKEAVAFQMVPEDELVVDEKHDSNDEDETSDEDESNYEETEEDLTFYEMLNDPMQIAAQFGHIPLIELFLEKGVDINAKDAKGQTPLFAACEEGPKETVKWLVERGADTDASAKSEYADWTDCATLVACRESEDWLTLRDYEKMYEEWDTEEEEEDEWEAKWGKL